MPPDKHYLFTVKVAVPYCAIQNTTATNYARALWRSEQLLGLEKLAAEYEQQARVCCTDGDKALARVERAVAVKHPGVMRLRTTCHVHRMATNREGSVSHQEVTIARLKHAVLALRSSMATFRQALRVAILSKLRIVRDRPPSAAARLSNARALNAFIPEKPHTAVRRRIILGLVSGDFSQREHIETHPPAHVTDNQV